MNFDAVRDAIVTHLQAVSGIGQVYGSQKLARRVDENITVNTVDVSGTVVVNVCWVTRTGFQETAQRDEAETMTLVEQVSTWVVTLMYGFKDGVSEDIFQVLVDAIAAAFRDADNLGVTSVDYAEPAGGTLGLAVYGGVVCHRGDIQIRVKQTK